MAKNEPIVATAAQMAEINAAVKKIKRKQMDTRIFHDYYRGAHRFNFQSEKFKSKFGTRLQKFRDNLCKTCVNAPADRLEVIGFQSEQDKTIYDKTWKMWKYSSMPRLAKRVHRDAFKTGDAYVLVWSDERDRSRIYPQKSENCVVWYDQETGKVAKGAKIWKGLDKRFYLTLYYPDRVEKYVTIATYTAGSAPNAGTAFVPRVVPGEMFPLPNPIGVCPLFHFGLEFSILDDVIPLNDALNKECADLLIGSESNSMRQRWSTGITYDIDEETGKRIIPFEAGGQWAHTEKQEGKFGEFADVSLSDFLGVIDNFRLEIARVTGIPSYYFLLDKGAFPSGEALEKAESRFTSIVKDAQSDFGETWRDAMAFALANESEAPAPSNDDDFEIETQWSPASPQSESQKLDNGQKKKNLGVSIRQILSEIGYADADIDRILNEAADETKQKADAVKKMFDQGGDPSGGDPGTGE